MDSSEKTFWQKFIFFWKHYVIQCILATVVIYLILMFLSIQNAVVIASLGASTFIAFAMPKQITAEPRHLIGGHLIGLTCGSIFYLIPTPEFITPLIIYALAVGLSIFIMVVTNTEHPPASGTALGVAITGFSWNVALAVITSVIALSFIHVVFRGYLEDLT